MTDPKRPSGPSADGEPDPGPDDPRFAEVIAERALARLDAHRSAIPVARPVSARSAAEVAPPTSANPTPPVLPVDLEPPTTPHEPRIDTEPPLTASWPAPAPPAKPPPPTTDATRMEPPLLPPGDAGVDTEPDSESSGRARWRWLAEWTIVLAAAVGAALIMRALVFQVFYIPSASMEPTLQEGDRVAVNKLDTTPERGDIMVFERPPNSPPAEINDLIKRTIALPGETIVIEDGEIYIDDQLLAEPYLSDGVVSLNSPWTAQCANERGDASACLVPEDHYFMMGDNRPNSWDSRRFGPIDKDLFVGRAVLMVWPLNEIGRL